MGLPTITLIGNLKRIETKFTQSGKQITSFQVECSEKNAKGEYENLYIKGECWEKSAAFVNDYFQEGSPAVVTGKLHTNVYTKADGTKVYENKLMFPNVSFVPKDRSDSTQQTPQQRQAPVVEYQNAQGQQTPPPQRQPQQPPVIDVDESEIPF